ncbi:uncharacterized protein METZ01_LOCUS18876 [marine metagenome]|uniref:histidine kinase n=1 Tax=marine metagenome TaxID=408172 RepID=A0A381PGA9_9ZZZZ
MDEALGSLAGYLENRADVSATVNLDLDAAFLPECSFVSIWHFLQEPFSNIEKYSRAKKVSVSPAICDGDICLTITHEGGGYGLSNIKGRAGRLGGILHIDNYAAAGTNLDIKVPVPVPIAWPSLV